MMALEDQFDRGILEVIDGFQTDAKAGKVRMGTLVTIIAECGADGEGLPIEDAQRVFDALGTGGSADLLGGCIEKAFPEAKEGGKGTGQKNPRKASRQK
jgi:hypothetical protein